MVKFAKVSRNDNWVYGFVLVFHSSYLGNQGKDKNLESWRQFNIPTILVCVFFPQFCKCNKLLILYYIILIDFLLAFFFTWHCFSNHKSIKHPDRWFNIRFFRGKKKKRYSCKCYILDDHLSLPYEFGSSQRHKWAKSQRYISFHDSHIHNNQTY